MTRFPLAFSRRNILQGLAFALPAFGSEAKLSASTPMTYPRWFPLDLTQSRYLTLPVKVNGQAMRGIVDTGTTQSIVRHDVALEMGLPYLGSAQAETFTEQLSGSLYRIERLDLSGVELTNITFGAFDTPALSQQLQHNLFIVLGQDILKAIDIETDFVGRRIRCFRSGQAPARSGHQLLSLYGTDQSFPSVRLLLEGRHHDDAIADFGSDVPMLMSADFARDTKLLENRLVSTAVTVGAEGATLGRIFCLDTVKLGSFTMRGVPVQVIEDWKMALPMYVGWSFFRAFDAILSVGHQTLRLNPDPAVLTSSFPKDRSGMSVWRDPDQMVILHVARDSPAWNAGLREEDNIVSVDGRRVTASYPPRGKRLGSQAAGTIIKMKLKDGRNVDLTLNDYF